MPIQPLTTLPPGSAVFIDANVFVYAVNGQSLQCADLLAKCSREELLGVTLFAVFNEATHRLMLAEAVARGFITTPTARALQSRAQVIPSLRAYWERLEPILKMDLLFVPAGEPLVRQAHVERTANGLLTNDSLILACMRHYGIPFIASNDEDFGAISGITLFRPDDLP